MIRILTKLSLSAMGRPQLARYELIVEGESKARCWRLDRAVYNRHIRRSPSAC